MVLDLSEVKEGEWPWAQGLRTMPEVMATGKPWPRISIVMPSLNHQIYLEQAIRSVLLQCYPNLEFLVIDGGSTDGSVEIIKKYVDKLSYWVSEADNGHADALNKGFRHSTGEIMAWLNSDDMYHPGALKTVAEIFSAHQDIHWITGLQSLWNHYGHLISVQSMHKDVYDYLAMDYRWIQQESTFWRRSLWEKAGSVLNDTYKFQIDAELWCRFFMLERLWNANTILGGYRLYKNVRSTAHRKEVLAEIEFAIKELRRKHSFGIRCRARMISLFRNTLRVLAQNKFLIRFLERSGMMPRLKKWFENLYGYPRLVYHEGQWVKAEMAFFHEI